MRIGVIGVGAMGRNHVRIYSELRGIEEIYAFDLDETLLKSICNKFKATPCNSVDTILKNVDAVSICVPTKYHFDITKRVIESNIHCLIEKPVTPTWQEGKRLQDIANNGHKLIVGVGHVERFNPTVNEIKKLLVDPKHFEIKRHNPASARVIDTDVVTDLMIHDIDLIWNYFFNNTKYELYSIGNNDIQEVLAKFGDCIVTISASRVACKKVRSIYIECEEFTIDGDFMSQEVYLYRKPKKYGLENAKYTQENIVEKVMINKVEPLREELKTFIECVKTGTPFPVTLEQGVSNLNMVERIREWNSCRANGIG